MPGAKPDTASSATPEEARAAIAEYTSAVEQQLRPALEAATIARRKAQEYLLETEQMDKTLHALDMAAEEQPRDTDECGDLPPRLEARVNIGEEFYVKANVYILEPVIVDVGLGFLVEMSRAEVRQYVQRRKNLYEGEVDRCSKRIETVQAHLKSLLKYLGELKGEAANAEFFAELSNHFQGV